MSNLRDYQRGRDDGMKLAVKLVREGGPQALEDEIKFRNITGVQSGLTHKELDQVAEEMKELTIQTLRIAFIAILHDEFGFGKVRILRAMDGFDKLTAYLSNGWLCWLDLINEIKDRLGLEPEVTEVNQENLGIRYAHPTTQDVMEYTGEPPWLDPAAWKAALRVAKFYEKPCEDGTDAMELCDSKTDEVCFTYTGSYQQIQLYDFLLGVIWVQEREAELEQKKKEEQPKQPQQSPQPKQPQTKKRRRKKR